MTAEQMLAELQAALEKGANPEGYYTTDELADMLGLSLEPTRRRLRKLMKAGRLERTTKHAQALDGRSFPVPAYRILPAT